MTAAAGLIVLNDNITSPGDVKVETKVEPDDKSKPASIDVKVETDDKPSTVDRNVEPPKEHTHIIVIRKYST